MLAMAFPDLNSARSVTSSMLRQISIGIFWVHHGLLLFTPIFIQWRVQGTVGRFAPPRPIGAGMVQYIAFIYGYIGVVLCAAALFLGRNLNYSLWPPTLPASVLAVLGGTRYRVTVGCFLAFVLGPSMRLLMVPGAARLCSVWKSRQKGFGKHAKHG